MLDYLVHKMRRNRNKSTNPNANGYRGDTLAPLGSLPYRNGLNLLNMAALYSVTFLATGKEEDFCGTDNDRYVLEDGSRKDVMPRPVWCKQCDRITLGEWVQTLEEMDRDYADLDDPKTESGKGYLLLYPNKKEREAHIDSIRQMILSRRRWLVNRVAPAKCLICGTTDMIDLKRGEAVETPAGAISVIWCGHASMSYNPRYFSPEGDRIQYTPPPNTPPLIVSPKRKWWQFWKW